MHKQKAEEAPHGRLFKRISVMAKNHYLHDALQRDRTVFKTYLAPHGICTVTGRCLIERWMSGLGGRARTASWHEIWWNKTSKHFVFYILWQPYDNLATSLRHLTTMIFGLLVLQVFCAPCLYFGSFSYLSWFRTSLVFVESSALTKTSLDSCRMEKTKEALRKKILKKPC